jgi:DNA gyrase/topoisomerase IV subunit B
MPPFYKVIFKKRRRRISLYDKALEKYRKKIKRRKIYMQRYKGLGEMDADQYGKQP